MGITLISILVLVELNELLRGMQKARTNLICRKKEILIVCSASCDLAIKNAILGVEHSYVRSMDYIEHIWKNNMIQMNCIVYASAMET